jgi:hypothetical protein
LNDLIGEIGMCLYCPGDVVAHGVCQSCLEWMDEDELVEPDPYGHGDDYYPDFDG